MAGEGSDALLEVVGELDTKQRQASWRHWDERRKSRGVKVARFRARAEPVLPALRSGGCGSLGEQRRAGSATAVVPAPGPSTSWSARRWGGCARRSAGSVSPSACRRVLRCARPRSDAVGDHHLQVAPPARRSSLKGLIGDFRRSPNGCPATSDGATSLMEDGRDCRIRNEHGSPSIADGNAAQRKTG